MRKVPKEKKTGAIIVIFIIFIMVASVIGYLYNDNTSQSVKVNGKTYYATQDGWLLTLDKTQYVFSYLPNEVNFPVPPEAASSLTKAPMVYITYDPNDDQKTGFAQIQYELGGILTAKKIFVQNGFISQTQYNLPVITCANATAMVPVLYLKTGEGASVTVEANCIIAQSDDRDLARLRDSLMFSLLGLQ